MIRKENEFSDVLIGEVESELRELKNYKLFFENKNTNNLNSGWRNNTNNVSSGLIDNTNSVSDGWYDNPTGASGDRGYDSSQDYFVPSSSFEESEHGGNWSKTQNRNSAEMVAARAAENARIAEEQRQAAAKQAKYNSDRSAGKFNTTPQLPDYATNPQPYTPRQWDVQPTIRREYTPRAGSMASNPNGMVGEGQTALAKALKAGAATGQNTNIRKSKGE